MAERDAESEEDEAEQARRVIAVQRLKARRKKERREKEVSYMDTHRAQLEKTVQKSLNILLRELPVDPFSVMLEHVSEHTRAGMSFTRLRAAPCITEEGDAVAIEAVASARGSQVSFDRAVLPKSLIARGLAAAATACRSVAESEGEPSFSAWAEDFPDSPEEAEGLSTAALSVRLRGLFGSTFSGAPVLGFDDLQSRIDGALRGRESPDLVVLSSRVGGVLLDTAGRLQDGTAVDALRSGFFLRGSETAPLLRWRDDVGLWQRLWPELLLTAMQGSTPRRRLLVGVTVWASTLMEASAVEGAEPLQVVDYGRHSARLAALEGSDGEAALAAATPEAIDDDSEAEKAEAVPEIAPAEPDEVFPPLNAIRVAAAVGSAVVAKTAADGGGPNLPAGEDFKAALALFRGAIEGILPTYLQTEPKPPPPPPEIPEGEEAAAEAEGGDEEGADQVPKDPPTPALPTPPPPPRSVAEMQQRGSVYAALDLDADSAYDEEAGTYKFTDAEDVQPMTQEQLIGYCEQLCAAEPMLRVLLTPLSRKDPNQAEGYRELRTRLAARSVTIICDESLEFDTPPAAADPALQDLPPSVGRLRDLSRSPLGLAAQYLTTPNLYLQTHGLYDFGDGPLGEALLGASGLVGFADVSLALPEASRRFVLPPSVGGAAELAALLQPLESRLRGILVSTYLQDTPCDDGEPPRKMTPRHFLHGLKKLEFRDVEQIDLLFRFLDVTNSGLVSVQELEVLKCVHGACDMHELDEFCVWLCDTIKSRPINEEASGEAQPSPFAEVWQMLDRSRSGSITYGQFRAGLKKLRHPATLGKDDGRLLSIFLCLDLKCNGFITEQEFQTLCVLSAGYKVKRVVKVQSFLQNRFGSLKSAFRAMDEGRSGEMETDEWTQKMETQQGYTDIEDVRACCQLLDKDGLKKLTGKDFDVLAGFKEDDFWQGLIEFRDFFVEAYGTLDEAYDGFESRRAPGEGSRSATADGRPTTADSRSSFGDKGLKSADFTKSCKRASFRVGPYDPRLFFNFLDAGHMARVGRTEFASLGRLDSNKELEVASGTLRTAIANLRDFAETRLANKEVAVDEGDLWTTLFEDMRTAIGEDS